MVTTTQEGAAEGETRPAPSQQELRARALKQGAKALASGQLGQSQDASPAEPAKKADTSKGGVAKAAGDAGGK